MRIARCIIVLVLCLSILMLCGCKASGNDAQNPKYLEEVEELLGRDVTQAAKELGFREGDLAAGNAPGDYKLPGTIRYQGSDFEVSLYGIGENANIQNQSLIGVGYRTVVDTDPEKAVETAKAILEELHSLYGDPFRVDGEYKAPYISEEFAEAVQNGTEWSGSEKWTIRTDVQDIVYEHSLGEMILQDTENAYRYTATLDLITSEGKAAILLRYRLDFYWKT